MGNRMAMGGAGIVPRPREPNGRISRAHKRAKASEEELEVMRPTLERRCRQLGWEPTEENLMRARDQRLHDVLGRMVYLKTADGSEYISTRAYLGIREYEATRSQYRRVSGMPREHAKISSYNDTPAGLRREPDDAAIIKREERYMRADRALVAAGRDCRQAVMRVLFEQRGIDLDALERAGQALADHFGIDRNSGEAP